MGIGRIAARLVVVLSLAVIAVLANAQAIANPMDHAGQIARAQRNPNITNIHAYVNLLPYRQKSGWA